MGRASALVALGCMLAVTVVEGQVCCQAMTASCLACQNGVTVAEYCANNPTATGCEGQRVCCQAMTASCLACQNGVTVADYCANNPMVTGCPSEMCPDSPPQQCRMLCRDLACAADQCVMREGTCCELTCVAKKDPAPCANTVCPMDICPDGKGRRQVGDDCCSCKVDCSTTPCTKDLCSDGKGRRQIGDDCCACPKDPEPCCKALTAECLSCQEDTSLDEYCEENPHTTGCEGACCREKIKKGQLVGLNCMACFKGETKAEFCEHLLGETTPTTWWQDIDSWLSANKNREKKLRKKCKKYNPKNAREQSDITVSAGGESATAVRVRVHDDNAPVKCDTSMLFRGSVATNVILAVVIVILAVVLCRGRQDQISAEVEREPTGSSPSSSPTAKMQPSPVV